MTTSIAPLVSAPADADARRAQAGRDGYLFLPGLVPAEALAPLQADVARALTRRDWLVDGASEPALALGRWDDPRWVDFLVEILPSPGLRTLAAAPALRAVLGELLGGEVLAHQGDVCRVVSPGAIDLATPPHQDAAYLADPVGVWTAWLPLAPCPLARGPLVLWPGSHLGGVRPHAAVVAGAAAIGTDVPADVPWVGGDLAVGDVLLFSSLTVHRALPNTSADQLRVSIDLRFRRA